MLLPLSAMGVTTIAGLAIYKGISLAYDEWAGSSAEDDAKQTPDAEIEAKDDDHHQWILINSCGQLVWS